MSQIKEKLSQDTLDYINNTQSELSMLIFQVGESKGERESGQLEIYRKGEREQEKERELIYSRWLGLVDR